MRVSISLLCLPCLIFASCVQSNPEHSQTDSPVSSESKATAEESRPDVMSVEGLQQIAAQLRIGMENEDVEQRLGGFGLKVICVANSGVSHTKFFGATGLFDPVIRADFRRKSFESAYLREWIVEDAATKP